MSRTSRAVQADTISFRIDPGLKTALAEIAAEEAKPIGEILRGLIRDRIEQKHRREFEAEARRQSLLLAEAARDPDSEEAAIQRELDANFDVFARELAEREEASEKKDGRKWK